MVVAPLVGRELDLAVCLEQLKRVERGAAVGLLVRGPAGIGKSRLVGELVVRARQLGHPVLAGRADDLDHGIPYALFRDLLARFTLDDARSGPRSDADAAADAFRLALDEPGGTGDDHLGSVFAAAGDLLRAVAGTDPLVLVLEDLHVADRESAALVALLARLADVGVLTVVTLRPGSSTDLERMLEQMAVDGRAAVVDLEPLDRHEVQALVAAVLGATPDDALTDAVHGASKGNPFFARELALSYAEAGAAAVADGRARLVPGAPAASLRPGAALLRRVVGGPSADAELAKVLAVFGRFPLHHLGLVQRILDRSPAEVEEAFDRLVKAGLLVASGGGHEFSHPIVRATLYDDIGPAERRRIHAAIAAELATERRAGVVLDVLELATHVAASAEPGDAAAAEILLEAGKAVATVAPLVAAGHLRRAAELLPAGSAARAEALARESRALHLGGRPAEAAAVGQEALDGRLAGARRSATVALVVNDLYLGGRVREALAIADVELAAGADPVPLLAMQANILLQTGAYEEAAVALGEATDAATSVPAAELLALAHAVQCANHLGQVAIAADLLAEVDRRSAGGSPTVQLAAHELVAFADWRPGLLARIDERLEAARRLRPDGSSLSIAGTFDTAHARRLALRGSWDEALEVSRSASLDLEQRGTTVSAQLLLCLAAELLVDRGALDEAAAVADHLVTPIESLVREVALVRGRLHHARGDLAAAAEVIRGELD
ncbi:MAG TPA: AAA family ATPase, partial [Acidimicrobiales bacterium]|nr:AAA family ATPase [Acidimicrobiales bacterium]